MGHKTCPLCPKGQSGRYFYRIPYSNKPLLNQWEKSLGLNLDQGYYTHVCSSHFDVSDYSDTFVFLKGSVDNPGRPMIKETAVPRINLPSLEHSSTTVQCSTSHPPRKEVLRKVNRLEKLVKEKKKQIGDSTSSRLHLFPAPVVRRHSKPQQESTPKLSDNIGSHETYVSEDSETATGDCNRRQDEAATGSTTSKTIANATKFATNQDRVQLDVLVQDHFRQSHIFEKLSAPTSRKVIKIAPKASVQDKSKLIILQAPKQKLVIRMFPNILPKPASSSTSIAPQEPQTCPSYLPVATTGITTTTTSFITSSASNTTAPSTTASAPSSIMTGILPMLPKTVLEQQMLLRAMEVAQEWQISPRKFITPVKNNALPITSTPMSCSFENESTPSLEVSPVQSKRKLAFSNENVCDASLENISSNLCESSLYDATWKPSQSNIIDYNMSYTEEQNDFLEETSEIQTEESTPKEELLLVSSTKLMELLQRCTLCHSINCVERKQTGAYFNYKCICKRGHTFQWSTSEIYKKKPLINLQVAGAMLLTGQNFASMTRFAKLLNLKFFNKDTYYGIIENYAKPVICTRWAQERDEKLNKIRDSQEPCNIGGDARFDSRGKAGAKFGIYTMMNAKSDEILDFVVMQKGLEPGELESKGFMISMNRLVKHLGAKNIAAFCSDRNYTVGRRMKDHFPSIYHAFDVWHVSKGLNKNLAALAKKSPNIASWTRSISNHVWFCAANCHQSEKEMIRLWESLFKHLQDEHTWVDPDGTSRSCGHGDLTTEERSWKNWLDASEIKQLKTVLLKTRVVNQLKKCCRFLHTGCIESFHSLCLLYASKETQFSYSGMVLRNILAVMDHNANTQRPKVGTKWVYSNAKKVMVEKTTYEAKSDDWKKKLLEDVIRFATTDPELIEFDPGVEELLYPFHLPKNMTGVERPSREQLVAARRNRHRSK